MIKNFTPLFSFLLFFQVFLAQRTNSQTLKTYTASTAEIPNPGRGFYSHRETGANSSGNMVSQLTLADINDQRNSKNITVIFRLYYLGQFKSSNISTSFLNSIQSDFNAIRSAGAKVIVRFAYNSTNQTHNHTDDASKFWVLKHIAQIKSIILTNCDVLLCLQAGFIGTWGEWYYTHPDFTSGLDMWGNPVPNYSNRKEVFDSLLNIVTKDKVIQIRTPYYKQNSMMYGSGATGAGAAVTLAGALGRVDSARVAHHNDCFLASSTDYGTYINVPADKDYLEKETKYLINGGEVCNDDPTYTNCTNALSELKKLHFSFLNNDYNTAVLNRWNAGGCLQTIKNGLGYRLELIDGTFTDVGRQGYTYNISIRLKNVGYAPIYDRKQVQFLLKNNTTNTYYPLNVQGIDNRYWQPDSTYTISVAAGIGNLPDGNYNVYFALKDTGVNISSNPKYSVQFANTGIWDAATGYHLVRNNINIYGTNVTGTSPYTGTLWFGNAVSLPINLISFSAVAMNSSKVGLNWRTSANSSAKEFHVERSGNSVDFERLATIAALNKDKDNAYALIDAKPLQYNYYRLSITDYDGKVTYSKTEKVNIIPNSGNIEVFPNPAIQVITIQRPASRNINETVTLTDAAGRKFMQMKLVSYTQSYEVGKLVSGVYILTFETGETLKFIKQ